MKGNGALEKYCAFITSDKAIRLYGCDGIEKYTQTDTVLKMGGIMLTVRGDGLTIRSFGGGEVEVAGKLAGVDINRA